jgi:hypothetical protein
MMGGLAAIWRYRMATKYRNQFAAQAVWYDHGEKEIQEKLQGGQVHMCDELSAQMGMWINRGITMLVTFVL